MTGSVVDVQSKAITQSSLSVHSTTGSKQPLSKVPESSVGLSHQWAECYYKQVKSLAKDLLYNKADQEDATQQAMLELIQVPDQVCRMVGKDPWGFVKNLATAVITSYRRKDWEYRQKQPAYHDVAEEIFKKTGEWLDGEEHNEDD